MNNDQQQTGQNLNYQTQQQTGTMGQQTGQTMQYIQQTAQAAQTTTTQYNQVAGQASTTTTTQGEQAMQYQQQVARQETMQMNPKIGSFNELYDQQGAAEAKNQQLTTTTNQKGGVGTAILIVILFLALIGLVGYILYTKGIIDKDNKPANNNDNKTISLSIDDEKVINSYEVLTTTYFGPMPGDYFVGKDITAKDVSNHSAYTVAATEILKDKNMGVLDEGASFTVEELNKKIDELFGEDYEFTVQHYGCPIYDYDEAAQTFTKSELGCGFEAQENVLLDRVVMAEEHNNELDVYVRVLYGTNNIDTGVTTYFSDYGKTNSIGDFYGTDLSLSDISKGSLYKLTFAEKDGTFQFKTSKLMS